LTTGAEAVSPRPPRRFGLGALALGPGLVYILSSVGPSDLVSGSIAGATYGYSLLWLLAAGMVARYVIVGATARYVMVSGESLIGGYGRISRWVVGLWFLVAVVKRHTSVLAKLLLLGAAAHLVLPLPTRHSAAIWGLSSWTLGFVLMFRGRYRLIEKLSKPLGVVMGSCLAATALFSRPDPVELVRGALTPVLPVAQGLYSPTLVLMAVLSAATASFGNLKYSANLHEKGWRDLSFLSIQRRELLVSMCGMFCMLASIQVAAAGALQPHGIQIGSVEDLIPIFGGIFGRGGRIILGVTLWCMVFSDYLGDGASYGVMFSDAYYRFVRKSPDASRQKAGEMPAYRWVVLFLFVSPLYALLTDWTPIGLVLVKSALNLAALPVVTLPVLRLTADRHIMGDHANGWFTNSVLVLTTISAFYFGYQVWLS